MEKRLSHAITQHDLAEERLLNIQADTASKALEEKRKRIRTALEEGASIEPGLRSAELIAVNPEPYSVKPKPYKKLLIR